MFGSKTFIEEPHKVVLEQVIRQRPIIQEAMAARLYQIALDSFKAKGQIPGIPSISWSYIENEKHAVASATDMLTGIYVQLSGAIGSPTRDIAVGQKWAAQAQNPVTSQSEIKVW